MPGSWDSDYEDDYDDEPYEEESCSCSDCTGYGEADGEPVDDCPRCSTPLDNLDLLTETYVCSCGTTALQEREPGYPIYVKNKTPVLI